MGFPKIRYMLEGRQVAVAEEAAEKQAATGKLVWRLRDNTKSSR